MKATQQIENDMLRLWLTCTKKQVIVNTETGEVSISDIWISNEAKRAYDHLQLIYCKHILAEREVMHRYYSA